MVGPYDANWLESLITDICAGITVALTLIPQGKEPVFNSCQATSHHMAFNSIIFYSIFLNSGPHLCLTNQLCFTFYLFNSFA